MALIHLTMLGYGLHAYDRGVSTRDNAANRRRCGPGREQISKISSSSGMVDSEINVDKAVSKL
jgi:hypothetical protein